MLSGTIGIDYQNTVTSGYISYNGTAYAINGQPQAEPSQWTEYSWALTESQLKMKMFSFHIALAFFAWILWFTITAFVVTSRCVSG